MARVQRAVNWFRSPKRQARQSGVTARYRAPLSEPAQPTRFIAPTRQAVWTLTRDEVEGPRTGAPRAGAPGEPAGLARIRWGGVGEEKFVSPTFGLSAPHLSTVFSSTCRLTG